MEYSKALERHQRCIQQLLSVARGKLGLWELSSHVDNYIIIYM